MRPDLDGALAGRAHVVFCGFNSFSMVLVSVGAYSRVSACVRVVSVLGGAGTPAGGSQAGRAA
jgi:hypothetical protein